MKTITRKLSESDTLETYGNDATTMVLAGLCEECLPEECYTIRNRYDRANCSVRLFAAGSETPHGNDGEDEIYGENIWLQVQTAIDWDENAEISVEVDDDATESEIDEAWHDAAIDYVFAQGVRDDVHDSIVAALRKTCGVDAIEVH